MPSKRLSELLSGLEIEPKRPLLLDPVITGISLDSRVVRPGDLFVAIRGHRHDGHDYVRLAIEAGAVAIVCEQAPSISLGETAVVVVKNARTALADLGCSFCDHPTRKLFTVGVTGTKGKSSVCHYSATLLDAAETKLISTITNALEREVEQTTPEAIRIQQMASEAVDAGKKNMVLEISAHALAQERARGVDFDVAIFTNLSHDHLDYFSTRDEYLTAKLKLFQNLKPSALALINQSDPAGAAVRRSTRAEVLTFGMNPQADIYGEPKEMSASGSQISIRTPQGTFSASLHMPGNFYIENALAAVGVGLRAGLDLNVIHDRLRSVRHIEGRFERYATTRGFSVVIDFAHSPDSLEQILKTLRLFSPRVITVFGCGGDSDRAKRPEMGRISGKYSAYTILTNDNPKYEEPLQILKEIEAGLSGTGARYEMIEERWLAIDRAMALARPGDVVLIAGKGHERRQVFKDREIEFNDREYLIDCGMILAHGDSATAAARD